MPATEENRHRGRSGGRLLFVGWCVQGRRTWDGKHREWTGSLRAVGRVAVRWGGPAPDTMS